MNLKTILVASAAVSALTLAGPSQAEFYLSVFGGTSLIQDDDFQLGGLNRSRPRDERQLNIVRTSQQSTFVSHTGPSGYFKGYATHLLERYSSGTRGYFTAFVEGIEGIDSGYVIGASLGVELSYGFRLELELANRQGDSSDVLHPNVLHRETHFFNQTTLATGSFSFFSGPTMTGTPTATGTQFYYTFGTSSQTTHTANDLRVTTSADVSSFSLMANLWLDIDLGNRSPITPFFGGGIGLAKVSVDYHADLDPQWAPNLYHFDGLGWRIPREGEDWAMAWQLGAGMRYDLSEHIALSAQYRYFATGNITTGLDITTIGRDEYSFQSHDILVGLQFEF